MELVVWIIVGILAGLAAIVLVPVLVIGTWYVVMTVTLGLIDGIVWLLDQRWKHGQFPQAVASPAPGLVGAASGKVVVTG